MNKQTGFTLIELIVVIVILGILAATALPKMAQLSGDARFAVMKGAEGSMRAANSMIYARAASLGILNSNPGNIPANSMGNAVAISTTFGYATNVTAVTALMDLSPLTDFTIAAASLTHAKAAVAATCQVQYTAATATAPPVYTNTGSAVGCQ